MKFFVPNVDRSGPMTGADAEKAWQVCRKGTETDAGGPEAMARRVYRLDYVHNGRNMSAVVGENEDYYGRELVMAIIAFPQYYKICCVVRGYMQVGNTPMVGLGSVLEVEDFDPSDD